MSVTAFAVYLLPKDLNIPKGKIKDTFKLPEEVEMEKTEKVTGEEVIGIMNTETKDEGHAENDMIVVVKDVEKSSRDQPVNPSATKDIDPLPTVTNETETSPSSIEMVVTTNTQSESTTAEIASVQEKDTK